jgi:hypothetical protein
MRAPHEKIEEFNGAGERTKTGKRNELFCAF